MKIIDLATTIFEDEINQDSNYSIPFISTWLRLNVGKLNNEIRTCYTINNTTLEAVPELGTDESDIFKQIFLIKYFQDKIISNSLAAGNNQIVSIDSDGSRVRMTNKTTVAQTYIQAKKDALQELKTLVNGYMMNRSETLQVVGEEDVIAVDLTDTQFGLNRL